MARFLNETTDHMGRIILTAAKEGPNGDPVTDVQLMGSNAEQIGSTQGGLEVWLKSQLDDSNDSVSIGDGSGNKLLTNTFPGIVKSKEQKMDNSAFSRNTDAIIPGLAALYLANILDGTITSGNLAALRATKYRALLTATDKLMLSLNGTTPAPTGSDITNSAGGALVAGDFAIRDTNAHAFVIPMTGWKNTVIHISQDAGFTQTIQVQLYGVRNGGVAAGKLLDFNLPASAAANIGLGNGAVGVGGVAGTATAAMGAWYDVPSINSGFFQLLLQIRANTTAPTAGNITDITIVRTS